MNYVLIGCGRISKNHIIAAKENRLNIVAICDIKFENLLRCKESLGLPDYTKKYTDYRNMLRKEKIDLVAIATESGKHTSIALDCIDAGCNVIIEKPIALSIEDANTILKTAQKKGVKVAVGHQNRFNKSIQKTREALECGGFGKIMYGTANIRWHRDEKYYKSAIWRGTWEQDGGVLMNQCIHNIDLLCWMLGGDIVEVYGITDRKMHSYIETEDFGAAIIKSANGAYGIIEGTTNIYPKNYEATLCLFGEKGLVKIGGQAVNSIVDWVVADEGGNTDIIKQEFSEESPNIYGRGHIALYKDMVNAIVNDVEPFINGEIGKKALEVVLAIYKSAVTKQVVRLPLGDCSTTNFKGIY